MAIPIQFIPEITENKLSSSVQTKLNSSGGTSNPSIRVATTQSHLTTPLTGQEKEISIQGNITLTSNITFAANAIISDGGGVIIVGNNTLTFTNNSFNFPYNRTVIDLNYAPKVTETKIATGIETSYTLANTYLNGEGFGLSIKVNGIYLHTFPSDERDFVIVTGNTIAFYQKKSSLSDPNTALTLTSGDIVVFEYINANDRAIISDASTFSNGNINLRCFGLVPDGNADNNTGTDNKNVFIQATKIANKVKGSHLYINGEGTYVMSLVATRQGTEFPTNWYITNGVNLSLGRGVKIGMLTVYNQHGNELLAIWNSERSTVTGGEFIGDLKTHVFFEGMDEGCMGIRVVGEYSTKANTVTNTKIRDFVGDNYYIQYNPEFYHLNAITSATLTKGYGLDDSGIPYQDEYNRYAYSQLLSLNNFYTNKIMVVGGGSFSGFCGLDNQTYYAYFYDISGNFITKTGLVKFYQHVPIDTSYKQVRIVIHTPYDNYVDFDSKPGITVYSPAIPTHSIISNSELSWGLRQGISNPTPFTKIYGNNFHHNGRKHDGSPGSPGAAIDIEDGYQNLYDIEIYENTFKNNKAGVIFLKGSVDIVFRDNKILYDDDPLFVSDNSAYFTNGTRTQIYNNLFQGTYISLGRQDDMFNNNLQDCHVALNQAKDTFRNHSSLLNVRISIAPIDLYNQVSFIKDNIFKYSTLSNKFILYNTGNFVFENNIFDFTLVAIDDTLNLRPLTYTDSAAQDSFGKLSYQAQNEVLRGSVNNFIIKGVVPESNQEWSMAFNWGVVDMIDFDICTSLRLSSGGARNALFKNGKIDGKLNLNLPYFPSTNTGIFNVLTFDNIIVAPPNNTYLAYLDEASLFTSGQKDVDLLFKNSKFIMPSGNNKNKWDNFLHYGTTIYENSIIESIDTGSVWDLTGKTCGNITYINCEFKNVSVILRSGDRKKYSKPNPNCPSYADNATALAALGEGWYYKNTTSGKFDITNL